MNPPFEPSNRMKIMIRRKEIVRQAIAAETLEEEARVDAIADQSLKDAEATGEKWTVENAYGMMAY